MIRIKTPDICLNELRGSISKPEKAAFIGAVIMGLLTHFYAFSNKLYNYDELPNTPGGFIGAGNNRWFLELMGKLASHVMGGSYSLPFFNGMMALLLLAASAFLIVRMFEVKSSVLACCIGGFIVTFPAVTSMFCFMFLAVYYSVGIFLSVLAAYLLVRFPKNLVCNGLAVLAMACSLGSYQAYFPNTACILLISVLMLCAFGEKEQSFKELILLSLRYVIALALGMLLYFLLNRILLNYWGISTALGSYQGLDSMGQLTPQEVLTALKKCYQSFFQLCYENVWHLNERAIMRKCYGVILLLFGVSIVSLFFLKKGEWLKKAMMLLYFALFPVGLFLTYVMAPKADYYTLMAFSVVFLPIFLALWIDRYAAGVTGGRLFAAGLQWLAAGVSVLLIFLSIWYANGVYMSMEYTKLHDLAYFETMVTQIKSLEGFNDDMPIVFIGNNVSDQTNEAGSLLGKVFALDGKSETHVNGTSGIYIITKYLGYTPVICTYEETLAWMEREEVAEMSCYPDAGSIQVIDGTIVVKLSDYEIPTSGTGTT